MIARQESTGANYEIKQHNSIVGKNDDKPKYGDGRKEQTIFGILHQNI